MFGSVRWGRGTVLEAVAVRLAELMPLTSAAPTHAACISVVNAFGAAKCFFSKALAAHPLSAVVF